MQKANYGLALKTANAIKSEFTSTDIGYNYSSKVYAAMNNPSGERNELIQAYNIQPSSNLANEIARISLAMNDFPTSEKFLTLYFKGGNINEKLTEVLKNLKLVNTLTEQLKNQQGNAKAWIDLGIAYFNLGKFSIGEEAITNAIKVNPNDPAVIQFIQKYHDKLHLVKTGNK
jgi:tetratricopeptide (TPR) repeat protein